MTSAKQSVNGFLVGERNLPTSWLDNYVTVNCYLCSGPTLVSKVEEVAVGQGKERVIKSRLEYPAYLFPGWQVICPDCSTARDEEQLNRWHNLSSQSSTQG